MDNDQEKSNMSDAPSPEAMHQTTQPAVAAVPVPMGKVNLNPFTHLVEGNKNFFASNVVAALLMYVITTIVSYSIVLGGLAIGIFGFLAFYKSPGGNGSIAGALVAMLGLVLAYAISAAVFGQALARLTLTGARGQKEKFGAALKLAWQRVPLALLSFLSVIGIVFLIFLPTILVSFAVPFLGILLSVVAMIVAIVFMLHFIYTTFVLADDERPSGVGQVLGTSTALWKHSRGALICYGLCLLGLALLLSIASSATGGNSSQSISPSELSSPNFASIAAGIGLVSVTGIISLVISGLVGLAINVGFAHIYNKAKELL